MSLKNLNTSLLQKNFKERRYLKRPRGIGNMKRNEMTPISTTLSVDRYITIFGVSTVIMRVRAFKTF